MQSEPWLTRDKAMIDLLKSIGIEKGKPFNPTRRQGDPERGRPRGASLAGGTIRDGVPALLRGGAQLGAAGAPEVIGGHADGFADPDSYPVDARGVGYTYAFFGLKRWASASST